MATPAPRIWSLLLGCALALAMLTVPAPGARAVAGGGAISGTVTTACGVAVTALEVSAITSGTVTSVVQPDVNGHYTLSGLAPGQYVVRVDDQQGDVVPTFTGNTDKAADATVVTVADQAVTGVDIAVLAGGLVQGEISAPGQDTIVPILVDAAGGSAAEGWQPDGVGSAGYEIGPVRAGTYRLLFTTDNSATGEPEHIQPQWYHQVSEVAGRSSATAVVVGACAATTLTTESLAVGATISGSLLDETGAPLDGRVVWAIDARNDDPTGALTFDRLQPHLALTGASGQFTISGLTAGGSYLVVTGDPDSTASPWLAWPNVYAPSAAHAVTASLAAPVTGIHLTYQTPAFVDVSSGTPFHDEIVWMANQGITTGYADGTYRPSGTVARDAMAAFMYRFAGRPVFTPPGVSPFADVPTSHPFYKEISWLAGQGISTGWVMGDGTRQYRPTEPVARDAMAAFMYRLADRPVFTPPGVSPFADVSTGHPFYKEISWLAGQGVSRGWTEPDGTVTFRPALSITRDAMAAFMYRFAHRGG